jgi:transposase
VEREEAVVEVNEEPVEVVERGMLRPSFVPPPWQRELRDLTRYRRTLTHERTREKQRVEKLMEDTQVKLSAVVSDMFGMSGATDARGAHRR